MKKLSIDVGGTMLKYAIMDTDANIYQRGELPTPLTSLSDLLDTFEHIYQTYHAEVDGIALSLPGTIDSKAGFIHAPGALFYNAGISILEELHKRIPLPAAVENDGKCAALAEVWKGNLQDVQDGIVLVIGSGIGGGIIHQRKLLRGTHFFAGEVSYMKSDLQETGFQNVTAMKASTSALVGNVAKRKGIAFDALNGKDVFQLIQDSDSDAISAFEEMTSYLSSLIYNLQCILDPERILIGGGISKQRILVQTLQKKLNEEYAQLPFPIPHAQIDACAHYNDSNLIGALYNLLNP